MSDSIDAIENLEDRWIKIQSVTDVKKNFVKIIITDSGSGIPNKIVAEVLQPFYTTKELGKGAGFILIVLL